MRIGFYDHYLDTLGGGEKVLLTVLEEAVRQGSHDVRLLSPTRPDPATWRRLNVEVGPDALRWQRVNQLTVTPRTAGLDLLVVLHNFLPPVSLAGRSVAIVQFPFRAVHRSPALRRPLRRLGEDVRLRSYDTWVCYSRFVERHMRERLGVEPVVIEPPVDVAGARPATKGPSIIAVGRFFPSADANNKKHDVLIDAFRRLVETEAAQGWTLHLAGGAVDEPGTRRHLAELRERAAGLPVTFHPNVPADELAALYGEASLFWHAAGHGEAAPERQEHFGITTVEAMAWGCVPLVPRSGGQVEIVREGVDGHLWSSVEELVQRTAELAGDPQRRAALAAEATARAQDFSKQAFLERVRATILVPAR